MPRIFVGHAYYIHVPYCVAQARLIASISSIGMLLTEFLQQNAINRKLKDVLERIFQNKFSHTQARDWKPVFERDMAKFVLHLIVVHLDDSAL